MPMPLWCSGPFSNVSAARAPCGEWVFRALLVPLAWALALRIHFARRALGIGVPELARCLAGPLRPRGLWTQVGMTGADAAMVVGWALPGRRGDGRCLDRALLQFALLRKTGTESARLCLGVRDPASGARFAHAWVEVGGAPIGDAADPRRTHCVLVRLGPPVDAASAAEHFDLHATQ